jgi:hypothetical protein
MKRASLLLAVAGFLISPLAHAQQYATVATNCLREYYDPNSYNWLTYQNTCGQAIHITMVGRDGTPVGAIDIGPGRHDGPGLSAREVNAMGGMEAYACPAHYVAVEADDTVIRTQVVSSFSCKKIY